MTSPADAFDRRNLLTYLSLLFGVGAIAAASADRANVAGFAIAVAVIADTFDGRFARRFGSDPRRSALGVQLDSLADAIAFGIAPPLCSALLLDARLDTIGAALWGAAFAHAACAVTRLASFKVDAAAHQPVLLPIPSPVPPKPHSGEGGKPHVEAAKPHRGDEGFIGIPVPLAALIWSTALLVQPSAAVTVGLLLATAAAMVLPLRVPRPTGAGLVLFTCWPLAVGLYHLLSAT